MDLTEKDNLAARDDDGITLVTTSSSDNHETTTTLRRSSNRNSRMREDKTPSIIPHKTRSWVRRFQKATGWGRRTGLGASTTRTNDPATKEQFSLPEKLPPMHPQLLLAAERTTHALACVIQALDKAQEAATQADALAKMLGTRREKKAAAVVQSMVALARLTADVARRMHDMVLLRDEPRGTRATAAVAATAAAAALRLLDGGPFRAAHKKVLRAACVFREDRSGGSTRYEGLAVVNILNAVHNAYHSADKARPVAFLRELASNPDPAARPYTKGDLQALASILVCADAFATGARLAAMGFHRLADSANMPATEMSEIEERINKGKRAMGRYDAQAVRVALLQAEVELAEMDDRE